MDIEREHYLQGKIRYKTVEKLIAGGVHLDRKYSFRICTMAACFGTPLDNTLFNPNRLDHKMAKVLIEGGADVHTLNKKGRTLLDAAIMRDCSSVAKILVNLGVGINIVGLVFYVYNFYDCLRNLLDYSKEQFIDSGEDENSYQEIRSSLLGKLEKKHWSDEQKAQFKQCIEWGLLKRKIKSPFLSEDKKGYLDSLSENIELQVEKGENTHSRKFNKAFLTSQSDFFAELFSKESSEIAQSSIKAVLLDEMSLNTFCIVSKFLKGEKVQKLLEISSLEDLLLFLKDTEKYKIEELLLICEKVILERVNQGNAQRIFEIAV